MAVLFALYTSQIVVTSKTSDFASSVGKSFLTPVDIIATSTLERAPEVHSAPEEKESKNDFQIKEWKFMGISNNVATYVAQVPGSALLAFRGLALFDRHISCTTAPFANADRAYDWIDMLEKIEELPFDPSQVVPGSMMDSGRDASLHDQLASTDSSSNSPHTHSERDLVYELFKLPWPIKSRDILLCRDWNYTVNTDPATMDSVGGALTINYKSIEDKRFPISKNYIRSESPHTQWKFVSLKRALTSQPADLIRDLEQYDIPGLASVYSDLIVNPAYQGPQTLVAIECLVDSKGSIPAWFINFMQRNWPSKSLTAFRHLVDRKTDPPFTNVKDW